MIENVFMNMWGEVSPVYSTLLRKRNFSSVQQYILWLFQTSLGWRGTEQDIPRMQSFHLVVLGCTGLPQYPCRCRLRDFSCRPMFVFPSLIWFMRMNYADRWVIFSFLGNWIFLYHSALWNVLREASVLDFTFSTHAGTMKWMDSTHINRWCYNLKIIQ